MKHSFLDLLVGAGLTSEQAVAAGHFRDEVLAESQRQNLTRLLEPEDFFRGHIVDVLELRRYRAARPQGAQAAVDLGSGAGVPGLLSAVLFSDEHWTLVDSELRKAEFLGRTVERMGLSDRVKVLHGRIDQVWGRARCSEVVSRAVGSVEKIYSWLEGCSTWNSLILLKGPRWPEEWSEFSKGRWKGELAPGPVAEYSVEGQIQRLIIQLNRVS